MNCDAVISTTIIAVVVVSRPVGHTTFAVSARTCRMNSPGVGLATMLSLGDGTAARGRSDRKGRLADVAKSAM